VKQISVNYELSLLATRPQKACLYRKQIIESNWDLIVNKILKTRVIILRLKSTVLSIGIIAENWDFKIKQSVEFQYVLIIKVCTETYIMICAACNGFSLQVLSLAQIHVSTSNVFRCISLYIPIQIKFRLYAGSKRSV